MAAHKDEASMKAAVEGSKDQAPAEEEAKGEAQGFTCREYLGVEPYGEVTPDCDDLMAVTEYLRCGHASGEDIALAGGVFRAYVGQFRSAPDA